MRKYFDTILSADGKPVAGASVTVALLGSTSPTSIFSNSAGSTPLTNPLTTDANGFFEFYAADGRYTLIITANGYSTRTVTDIALDDPADASQQTINGGSINNTPIGATTPNTGAFTTLSATTSIATAGTLTVDGSSTLGDSGSADVHAINGATSLSANSASPALTITQSGAGAALNLGGTGARVTADFSNGTVVNRTMFQTNSANGITIFPIIPNGTATQSLFRAYNASTPTNASYGEVNIDASTVRFSSNREGSGAMLPMAFSVNNADRITIDTAGNTIQTLNGTAATLTTNSTLTFSLASNTQLRVSVRGSDGVTRTATITLA